MNHEDLELQIQEALNQNKQLSNAIIAMENLYKNIYNEYNSTL